MANAYSGSSARMDVAGPKSSSENTRMSLVTLGQIRRIVAVTSTGSTQQQTRAFLQRVANMLVGDGARRSLVARKLRVPGVLR
jgi:hypothetical protein